MCVGFIYFFFATFLFSCFFFFYDIVNRQMENIKMTQFKKILRVKVYAWQDLISFNIFVVIDIKKNVLRPSFLSQMSLNLISMPIRYCSGYAVSNRFFFFLGGSTVKFKEILTKSLST